MTIDTVDAEIKSLAKPDERMIAGRLVNDRRETAMDIDELTEELSDGEHAITMVDMVLYLSETLMDGCLVSEGVGKDMSEELASATSLTDIECPIETDTLILIITTREDFKIFDRHIIEDDIVICSIERETRDSDHATLLSLCEIVEEEGSRIESSLSHCFTITPE